MIVAWSPGLTCPMSIASSRGVPTWRLLTEVITSPGLSVEWLAGLLSWIDATSAPRWSVPPLPGSFSARAIASLTACASTPR